jgi:hypothetical protein
LIFVQSGEFLRKLPLHRFGFGVLEKEKCVSRRQRISSEDDGNPERWQSRTRDKEWSYAGDIGTFDAARITNEERQIAAEVAQMTLL